jgi:ComF family protein
MLKQFFDGVISFALPAVCLCCENILTKNSRFICGECHSRLRPFNEIHPWKKGNIRLGIIDNSISMYWFTEHSEIQTMLHALKYEKMKSIGTMFGKELGERIKKTSSMKFDYVIPVPLHKSRERERTYNQSAFICKGINEVLNTEAVNDCLKRTRFTESQTRLDKEQRKDNVKGAFEIRKKYSGSLKGKNIILADDVITTGATILECARILKSAGCGKVIICSIAYAVL